MGSADTYNQTQILYDVPMVPQGDSPICWVACVAMIVSWQTGTPHSVAEYTGGAEPSTACISEIPDWENRLTEYGFTLDGMNMTLTSDFIWNTLVTHGPILVTVDGANFPFSGTGNPVCQNMPADSGGSTWHSMVIEGVDTDQNVAMIQNPWGNLLPPIDIGTLVSCMQEIADAGAPSASYIANSGVGSQQSQAPPPSC
jgi:hypothetical protein